MSSVTREQFIDHLNRASVIVASWPTWKAEMLDDRGPAMTGTIDDLLTKLAAAEAEAAAYRDSINYQASKGKHSIYSFIKQHTSDFQAFGNTPEVIAWAKDLLTRLDACLSGTAGRELLAESKRKDAELQDCHAAYRKMSEAHDRLWRKCRTAKAALHEVRDRMRILEQYRTLFENALHQVNLVFQTCSEIPNPILPDYADLGEDKFCAVVRLAKDYKAAVERVSELEAQIRDGVKAAYDAADKEWVAKEWADEPAPAWQYRTDLHRMYLWGTCDRNSVYAKLVSSTDNWSKSGAYDNWQACCDDPSTYPCDESGERIDTVVSVAMSETEIDADGVAQINAAVARGEAKPKIEFKPVEQSDTTLAVGDWVEPISGVTPPGLEKLTKPYRVSHVEVCFQIDGDDEEGPIWSGPNFRRVPSPAAKDDDLLAAARELREWLIRNTSNNPAGRLVFTAGPNMYDEYEVLIRKLRDAKGGGK